MLYLYLTNILPGRPMVLGPAPWFEVSGDHIRSGPNRTIVAEFVKQNWYVNGEYFTTVNCRDRSCVLFEDGRKHTANAKGPFQQLKIVNGVLRADEQVVAKLSQSAKLWRCQDSASWWPVVTIKLPSS